MNISDTSEKSKASALVAMRRSFIPIFIPLVFFGAFGLWKLYLIERSKVPITIENTEIITKIEKGVTNSQVASSTITDQVINKIQTGKYVASRGGTSYYLPSCSGAKRISEKNKIWFQSKEEAERFGYKPSKTCKEL